MRFMKCCCLVLNLLLIFSSLKAQKPSPVGSWQSHFSYNTAASVEHVGHKIFCGSLHLLEYDADENEFITYSKTNGLSDVDIRLLRYDSESGYLLIIYNNGNMDIWKEGQIQNLQDIKSLNITGSKKINSVYFRNGLAYLSTDFGIVVVNPARKEIKESYSLQDNSTLLEVKDIAEWNGYFYTVTNKGVFKADVTNSNLQNFTAWTKISSQSFLHIMEEGGKLFMADDTALYQYDTSPNWIRSFRSHISRITKSSNGLLLTTSSDDSRLIFTLDDNGMALDSITGTNPLDITEMNGSFWVADYWQGLMKVDGHQTNVFHPNGIYTNATYNLNILNDELYVSAGGEISWVFTYNSGGISHLQSNGDWNYYNRFVGTPGLDTVNDIMEVSLDKRNGKMYAASFHDGLWEYDPKTNGVVNYKNTEYIQSYSGYRVAGLTMDKRSNLWMTNYGSPEQLVVKKADGTWQKFSLPFSGNERSASQVVIDDVDQKWVVAPRGIGVYVYNDNGTIDQTNDDQVTLLRTGAGQGNLSNNEVTCIAKDKNGKLWIGTLDGISIINCPESIFSAEGCDAELKIVKYDLDAGYLFHNESVKTIAVDGANNKWIGTSNGVWLISDDAEKILKRFTIENSPLPTNEINKIVIHPTTGDVFIATSVGLVSYRGEATDGNATNEDMLIYPNPVPAGFEGSIVVTGLVENADVRITDAAGQLVYRTKAQGGQAVWNGKNYLGNKPRTGVYYVYVTNSDGSEAKAGKFIINE